jgi:hypothetical protein
MRPASIYSHNRRGQSESPSRSNGFEPIEKPSYYNEAIELELVVFKKEIEDKYAKSIVNRDFIMPLLPESENESHPVINTQRSLSRARMGSRNIKRTQSTGKIIILRDTEDANGIISKVLNS